MRSSDYYLLGGLCIGMIFLVNKSIKRLIYRDMKISSIGASFIKTKEGLQLNAYKCSAGVWTIGYGHTSNVKQGDSITKDQADIYFNEDIQLFENVVNSYALAINQNQFDALVSFVFNVGTTAFRNSTLLKIIKANPNDSRIKEEFLKWNKAGGVIVQGLTIRRKEESNLYFS